MVLCFCEVLSYLLSDRNTRLGVSCIRLNRETFFSPSKPRLTLCLSVLLSFLLCVRPLVFVWPLLTRTFPTFCNFFGNGLYYELLFHYFVVDLWAKVERGINLPLKTFKDKKKKSFFLSLSLSCADERGLN